MKTTLLEFIYQFEVNKGTKEVFGNFFFKATKSENSNKSYKIVRFRQGFAKRSMASSREFAWFEFFWFLCSLVLIILSACAIIQQVGPWTATKSFL